MIRINKVMAIARAQRIINRRLVRYWLFLTLAFFISLLFTMNFSNFHASLSSFSGSVGAIYPRFLMSTIGFLYTIIFLVGTVFLSFDVRARDKRERVLEVLDSKPISNLELLAGKFTGIFLSSWIPMVVLVILIQFINFILKSLHIPFGETIESFSLLTFIFIMAVPALSFVIALVFFVTLLIRSRLAATIILLILLVSSYVAAFNLPLAYGMLFDIIGVSSMDFASDIVPHFATTAGWFQRLSVLFAAFALLGFSAVVHPRLESGSRKKAVTGSFIAVFIALLFAGGVYSKNIGDLKAIETWKQAHSAVSNKILPDLKKISGDVNINPGKALHLDMDITFGAPGSSLEKVLFTFNPGLEVKNIIASSGKTITFTHKNGLLEFILSEALLPGEETTIHLTAQGKPDIRFAFLYSDASPLTLKLSQVRVLVVGIAQGILGTKAGLFDKSFVALMPALRWLPASGSEKGRDDQRVRAVDFFDLDLQVNLPKGWIAAGPGLRHKVESNNGGTSFRFSPPALLPEAALIASRFESRSMEVEGIKLEILINKKHIKNLNLFTDIKENIREWADNHLKEAKEYGLGYPYDAITLVEVPNTLRCYGGGWRMDTAMSAPGILLMREMGFPTANFSNAFKKNKLDKNSEEEIQEAKLARLKLFFSNDFSGGNIFAGISKNFFLYQTSAKGPEALALNYIMEHLSNQLITEAKSYYSAHQLLKDGVLQRAVFVTQYHYGRRKDSRKTSMVDLFTTDAVSRPDVWDRALGVSLKDIDPLENPALTVDVLHLKANAIAQSMLDTLGYEKTGKLLASIRQDHKGDSFTLNDVLEARKALGHDLTESLGYMLTGTDLPGFVCEDAEIYRLTGSEDGSPRYQMLLTIRNDEPVSGSFRFAFEENGDKFIASFVITNMVIPPDRENIIKSRIIHLKGKSTIKYGTIVSKPPVSVSLEPYLSLNRYSFLIPLNKPDEKISRNLEPIEGIVELPYTMPHEISIIVDDLDSGFSISEELTDNGTRLSAKKQKYKITDQGLPIGTDSRFPPVWSRLEKPESYGKYRHTLTAVMAGKGEQKAVFTAPIKKADRWDLELFIPEKSRVYPMKKWGKYNLVIKKGDTEKQEISFDSKAAQQGWNPVGRFDIPEGDVTVTISNKTDGEFVVADAIRWTPYDSK